MLRVGCHLSSSKGYENMGLEALSIDANTFQFFTRNPRGGKAKAIDKDDIGRLNELMIEKDIKKIVAHAPYTVNVCSAKENVRKFAVDAMADDLKRMEYLPGNMYNFHPGSHVGQGVDRGIELIVEALNKILKPQQSTCVLLETMAGKGTELGSKFSEIRRIIDKVDLDNKLGVCLDTCHVFNAGYDIVNDLDGVLEEFDKVIGLDRLKAIHLNDSMNSIGSHKDRHQKLSQGYIGKEAIANIINHEKLKDLPFILETPNDISGYKEEIRMLRELKF